MSNQNHRRAAGVIPKLTEKQRQGRSELENADVISCPKLKRKVPIALPNQMLVYYILHVTFYTFVHQSVLSIFKIKTTTEL